MNKASSVLMDYQKRGGEGRGGEGRGGEERRGELGMCFCNILIDWLERIDSVTSCCLWNFDVGLVRKSDQIRPKSRGAWI